MSIIRQYETNVLTFGRLVEFVSLYFRVYLQFRPSHFLRMPTKRIISRYLWSEKRSVTPLGRINVDSSQKTHRY